jgi:hypothetical protein
MEKGSIVDGYGRPEPMDCIAYIEKDYTLCRQIYFVHKLNSSFLLDISIMPRIKPTTTVILI